LSIFARPNPQAVLKPEKGAAFVGCYLGFIPSDASRPTDVGFYERIALGRNSSGLMDARAKRAFRTCARTCAGYPHAATAVVPAVSTEPTGLVLECLCTFRLAHGESDLALTRDEKCAGELHATRGCVAGPCGTAKQSAVFSLPDVNYPSDTSDAKSVLNVHGAEYLGCYTGYSGWEASDPLFAAHLMIASPPPPSTEPHAASDFYQRSSQLKNSRQAPGASLGASETYDPRSDAHDARFLGDLLDSFIPTYDELGGALLELFADKWTMLELDLDRR
jgi:hypothetical protein